MQRDAAWMSMSEGNTGTTIACASCVSSGSCSGVTAAGVSTMSVSVPGGVRSAKARVTPSRFSYAAMPWIGGSSAGRNLQPAHARPLRVVVHQRDRPPRPGVIGRQVRRDRRLARPTLGVQDDDSAQGGRRRLFHSRRSGFLAGTVTDRQPPPQAVM